MILLLATFTPATLIQVAIVLVAAGLLVWIVEAFLPIPAPFKVLVRVAAVLGAIVYLLKLFGLF